MVEGKQLYMHTHTGVGGAQGFVPHADELR